MNSYNPETYGERIAERYDDLHRHLDPEAAVTRLSELAAAGPVLELGVGTGRVALPLLERGLEVHGIDASPAMVDKLRAKPNGDRIHITIGNFGHCAVDGRFSLIFVAFNTFFALLSQEEQIHCFSQVAERLTDDGVFVIEAFVPDIGRFDRGQRIDTTIIEDDSILLEASRHHAVSQRVTSRHLLIEDGRVEVLPVHIRYAWPSELDLMARLAGLQLRDRWENWNCAPFTARSGAHVSVYSRRK